jgi:hypothetical protein
MAEAEPTSPWHPTSAPEMEALCLRMPPMAAAVRRKSRVLRRGPMPGRNWVGEAQDGGDDAGCAIGGRGDDAAAGGILLVDGHGVEAEPVIGRSAGRFRCGCHFSRHWCSWMPAWRGAGLSEPSGQFAASCIRPRSMQAGHGGPDWSSRSLVELLTPGRARFLVGALHGGDGEAGPGGHVEHLGGGGEGPWARRRLMAGASLSAAGWRVPRRRRRSRRRPR